MAIKRARRGRGYSLVTASVGYDKPADKDRGTRVDDRGRRARGRETERGRGGRGRGRVEWGRKGERGTRTWSPKLNPRTSKLQRTVCYVGSGQKDREKILRGSNGWVGSFGVYEEVYPAASGPMDRPTMYNVRRSHGAPGPAKVLAPYWAQSHCSISPRPLFIRRPLFPTLFALPRLGQGRVVKVILPGVKATQTPQKQYDFIARAPNGGGGENVSSGSALPPGIYTGERPAFVKKPVTHL